MEEKTVNRLATAFFVVLLALGTVVAAAIVALILLGVIGLAGLIL